jgi:hypothetical protein
MLLVEQPDVSLVSPDAAPSPAGDLVHDAEALQLLEDGVHRRPGEARELEDLGSREKG